jgi:MarR family transcriptional regulator, organic hydroperoxide resistance regulator
MAPKMLYRATPRGSSGALDHRSTHRTAKRSGPAAGRPPSGAGDGPGSLGRVLDFMRLLWAVDHGLTRISRKMEGTKGVTGPQRLVVRLVGHRPGISAGALARTLCLHPSTLTEVLRRLATRGVLLRTEDPADARRALFHLTSKGLAIDASRSGTVESRVQAALRSLSSEDLAAASRVLVRIAGALSAQSEPPRRRRSGSPSPIAVSEGPFAAAAGVPGND